MKAMSKCVEEMVQQLSAKYGFDKAEALEFIMPAGEAVRGRPSKPKKKVVNKTEMVEDVIKTIMEEGGAPAREASLSNPAVDAEAVIAQAEAVIVASEGGLKGETPLKKKAAPRKKKVDASVTEAVVVETAVVEAVTEVQAQAEPVIVAVDAPKEKKKAAPRKKKAEAPAVVVETAVVEAVVEVQAQAEPVTVAAVVEAPKEKKKAAPKKKKAEAEAVVAQAEPVTVAADASEGGLKGDAPLKKKAAPKKKKAEAEAVVAQAEPVTVAADASEGGLKGDAPLKKKAAPKKKAEAPVVVVEAPKPVVVVEAAKPVVSPLELSADEEEGGALGGSPPTPSDDESTSVSEWTCKNDGKTYLKSCEDNCGKDTCDCSGVVYDAESQDMIGHWNGATIEAAEWQAGDD